MEYELRACPFCGGKAKIHRFGKTGELSVTVKCTVCKAQVQPIHPMPHFSYKARVEVVVRDWNRRIDNDIVSKSED
jgi:rRNA maturation protein Nop10